MNFFFLNLFTKEWKSKDFFFKFLKILKDLRFAIFILLLISLLSSIGSIIEQDQEDTFYELNYANDKALYGFLNAKLIFFFQFNHLYQSWYFLSLLTLLALSLILCSFYNQWPLLKISKKFFFNIKTNYFQNQKDFLKYQKQFFEKENLLLKLSKLNFYIYQNQYFLYAYKALIGRISPIFVHISLILLLASSFLSSFQNFKAQEIIARGEITHFQNILHLGKLTNLPTNNLRLNDFWINYQNKKIKQFYSNLSIINNYGKEEISKSISVNKPLLYNGLNIYQSDWNLSSLRLIQLTNHSDQNSNIFEYPFFSLNNKEKVWITWINLNSNVLHPKKKAFTLIFDQLRNTFFLYDEKGKFLKEAEINQNIFDNFKIIDLIKTSGLLIKYDPSINLIYLSFFLLILSTFFSFLPYERFCIYGSSNYFLIFLSKNSKISSSFF